jgi:hypothetical protein
LEAARAPFESEDELCQFDDECLLISICLRSDYSFVWWSCGRDFFSGQHPAFPNDLLLERVTFGQPLAKNWD